MGILNIALDRLAAAIGKRIQGVQPQQAYSDAASKGTVGSVESQICESLATLVTSGFRMPVVGGQRAAQLSDIAKDFVLNYFTNAMSMAFLSGDAIIVPSWNGHGFDNVVVDSGNFAILGANGREITSVIYVVDKKTMKNTSTVYTLMRKVELVPYTAVDGTQAMATRYKTYIMRDQQMSGLTLADFPDWAEHNEDEWIVPNTPRLLVARYRSFALDPRNPNAQKGTPICFGASQPIKEIHYLDSQMHSEFELSEKAVFADRSLFHKKYKRDNQGNIIDAVVDLPKGKERLFQSLADGGTPTLKEWAPSIQLQPYLDGLQEQYRKVENAVGISHGILSNPNSAGYENVDNVRKSMRKTQAFVNAARNVAEGMLGELVVCWDTLLNYYGIGAVGEYHVEYQWSDDYINTFSDQLNAIVAGQAFGGADAVDYRMLVFNETPEVAADRVAAIKESDSDDLGTLIGGLDE